MNDLPHNINYKEIVIVNDHQTPFQEVVKLLENVFTKSNEDADRIARISHNKGFASCGKYPMEVAQALLKEAKAFLDGKGYAVRAIFYEDVLGGNQAVCQCSFCDKIADDKKFVRGRDNTYICDTCLLSGAKKISGGLHIQKFFYTFELLSWHFYNISDDQIVTSERTFPKRMKVDLQRACNEILNPGAIKFVGIHSGHQYDKLTMSSLFDRSQYNSKKVGPLQYEDVDIGEDIPIPCLKNGLWLKKEGDFHYAVLCAPYVDYRGDGGITIETAVPPGEKGEEITQLLFRRLEKAVHEAQSYRGKVLSLEQDDRYSGKSSGIKVHKLSGIDRKEIILPDVTLNAIDHNIIRFAEKRQGLKKLGQSTKKGLLFHGAPGTGKTHTIRYLAKALKDHTTFIITAEQMGLLSEYFTLARLLQPAVMIIEDVDLIAKAREKMDSTCEEVLLNKLLNEMDGLNEDADIFIILTTNRPDILEEAIASRPGRVDQSIEFPLPDENSRKKLVHLYKANLNVGDDILETIVKKTEGVSASFIKELMRRIAQYVLESTQSKNGVTLKNLTDALEEMIFVGGKLNVKLLGGKIEKD